MQLITRGVTGAQFIRVRCGWRVVSETLENVTPAAKTSRHRRQADVTGKPLGFFNKKITTGFRAPLFNASLACQAELPR